MKRGIIEFGKRMDAASDKIALIERAKGCTSVLDLGAGTGKIARDISNKWNAHVDAVDIQFKDNCNDTEKITYYGVSVKDFLTHNTHKKYDCIVLSAILHELGRSDLEVLKHYLPLVMADNCRILIREPFYDDLLGPVKNEEEFIRLVSNNIVASKAVEFLTTSKLSEPDKVELSQGYQWANLAFTVSYGEQSWEREKHEFRYARSLTWCKTFFNELRSYTGFQVYPVKDETYRNHFIKAGIPKEAFDLIEYTGMIVVIDYSK